MTGSRISPRAAPAVVLGGFLLLSVALFRGLWRHPGNALQGGGDAVLFVWFLRWTPYAIAHGLDPFVLSHLGAPAGVNGMWNTTAPLLGLLAAPVTLAAGPVASLTVLFTLAPALSGWTAFLALRRWVSTWPAVAGGLLYGFSPYVVGHSAGHLNLVVAVFPPLALLLLDDLLVRQRHVVRTGVLLGLAAAAQLLVSSELLLTTALVAALGTGLLAASHRGQVRRRWRPAARGLAVAAAVALPLAAWPLYIQFAGPQRIEGRLQGVAAADLLSFVVPGPFQRLAPGSALQVSRHFAPGAVEVTSYLGVPLLAVLAVVALRRRHDPLVALCTLLGVAVAVLSLGPRLQVNGRVTGVRLPWRAVANLPLLENVLTARLSVFVALCAAVVLAVGLEGLRSTSTGPRPPPAVTAARRLPRAPRWRAGVVGAGVAAVALVPLVPRSLPATRVEVPRFFTGPAVRTLPPGSTVLVLPYPYALRPPAMLWQAVAGIRFRLVGCYCIVPDEQGRRLFNPPATPLVSALLNVQGGTRTADQALRDPDLRPSFARVDPAAVVLGPTPRRGELEAFVTALVGRPPRHVDGVEVWTLHP